MDDDRESTALAAEASAFPAGNYPRPFWPRVASFLQADDSTGFYRYIDRGLEERIDPCIFVAADIDGFTQLTGKLHDNTNALRVMLKTFFANTPSEILVEAQRQSSEARILKFLGDGWLVVLGDNVHAAISGALSAARVFRSDVVGRSLRTLAPDVVQSSSPGLAVSIARCPHFLEGFVASETYVDGTVYGVGINALFKAMKYADAVHRPDLPDSGDTITIALDLWDEASRRPGFEESVREFLELPPPPPFSLKMDDPPSWLRLRVLERQASKGFRKQ